jgi:hypothetical protein
MVFVRLHISAAAEMKTPLGFAFALSRLAVRLSGREVCQAEWSGLEAYGLCLLVFGIGCVSAARAIHPFVRPVALEILILVMLPVLLWLACLIVHYLIAQAIRPLRRLGLYSAPTNDPIQHLFFVLLTTFFSFMLFRSGTIWLQLLGGFWLALLGLNLLAIVIEKLVDRA